MEEDPDFDLSEWQLAVNGNDESYRKSKYPCITGSMDTGWQKRCSGRRYDSLSGHSFFVGSKTRKPIMADLASKFCRICIPYLTKELEPPAHDCTINHTGSSGSMEPNALIRMFHALYDEKKCLVVCVVTDDDSAMKSNLRWNNADYEKHYGHKPMVVSSKTGKSKVRNDTGRLRYPIPQPIFIADPSHRKKTLKSKLYGLKSKKVADSHGMCDVDCIRIATNFAYMSRQLPFRPEAEWEKAGKAVLLHHFDDHSCCSDFCKRKDETEDERQQSKKFYRSKERDAALFDVLQIIIVPFITSKKLQEVGHGLDTLVNESLNNTIAWVAPKNKTYCGSVSLQTRICIAVGIHILGVEDFYGQLFRLLGIAITPGTAFYLAQQQAIRDRKRNNWQKTETKRRRNLKFHAKLKEHTAKAASDRAKKQGYCPGIGMDVCQPVTSKHPAVIANATRKVCSSCGGTGHLRRTHHLCPNNKIYSSAPKEAVSALEQDREEQDMMDTLSTEDTDIAATLNALDDEEIDLDDNEEIVN